MGGPHVDLVVRGTIVVAARPDGLELAEAIAIAGGRVVAVGRRDEVPAPAGARVVDAGDAAVIPGLHDFHLHLVALARTRRQVVIQVDEAPAGVIARIASAAASAPPNGWIVGGGWTERQVTNATTQLEEAVGSRPAFLMSHDGHSAWASRAAMRLAGLSGASADPEGGRLERDPHGGATGVLRERAIDLVAGHVPRLQGASLEDPLLETVSALHAMGITGASEAGDYTSAGGVGADAAMGDAYSSLTDLATVVDGRLRLTLGIPADALATAAGMGLRTGATLGGRRTLRFGWAKHYTDGTLGSGTAARFSAEGELGIMRITPQRLEHDFAMARPAGIGLALHAIGDRAIAMALDAIGRASPRGRGVPRDRIEHVQLLRRSDAGRFASLGVIASIQPIHAAADRDLADEQWSDRVDDAYAWRTLAAAGAALVAGSDAPVESVDPWLGIFAAVHRRLPTDARTDWQPAEALSFDEALSAYTLGPAQAIGADDEGHLGVGARADLAVLTHGLEAIRAADENLAEVRAVLTIIDGEEVHRS